MKTVYATVIVVAVAAMIIPTAMQVNLRLAYRRGLRAAQRS